MDWDQLLTGDTLQKWKSLASELEEGHTVVVPRFMCSHNVAEVDS